MVEANHDVGEIWSKVEGLETNFKSLGVQVSDGFKGVFKAIQDSHDKTDKRIESLAQQTDTRFENQQNAYQQTSSQRATNTLTVVGILASSFIGVGGLGAAIITAVFAFYTLTKAPIDQQFYQADKATAENKADIKALEANTVPKAQVANIEETAKINERDIAQHGRDIADIKAHQEDVLTTLRSLPVIYATLDYTRSLDARSTLLSQRLQTIYDKNFATPAIPCIGSGCAATSAPTNGPANGTSNAR